MAIQDTQQTYSQHAVPQNIMDVEFKLIGDLTMRQFIYLMVFGLLAWVTFVTAVGIFRVPLSGFFVLSGLAMAFVPIQERGMDEWVVNFFKAISNPTQRVWKKETVLPPAFTYESLAVVRQEMITLAPTSSRRKLEDYLKTKQSQQVVDKLDIPEKEYMLKVRQAFETVSTGVAVEEELAPPQQFEAYKPFEPVQKEPPQPKQESRPAEPEPKLEPKQEQEIRPEPKQEPKPVEEIKQEEPAKLEIEATIIKSRSPSLQPKMTGMLDDQSRSIKSYMAYDPITPDMHVGRRFTNTLPSEGRLILPVKGEKVIATSEEIDIEKDIEEKTAQLRKLLEQVKSEQEAGVVVEQKEEKKPEPAEKPQYEKPKPEQTPKPEFDAKTITDQFKRKEPTIADLDKSSKLERIREEARKKRERIERASKEKAQQDAMAKKDSELEVAQKVVKDVKKENEALSNQIQRLKNEVESSPQSEEEKSKKRKQIEELEKAKQEKSADYSALQKQILELQRKLEEKEKPQQEEKKVEPKFSKMEPITNEPNIVSGMIKKSDGESIPGLVLLIKNHKGEAVRALKTNALGQFSISTPLVDGIYTLEVGSTVEDTTFDIITIEVKGEVVPPIELIGKEA